MHSCFHWAHKNFRLLCFCYGVNSTNLLEYLAHVLSTDLPLCPLENLWKKKRKVKGIARVGVTCGGVPTLKGITEECWELMTTAWVSGGGRYFRLGGLNDLFSLCLHLSSPTLILPTCFILPTNVYHFTYIWVLLRMAFKGQDWLGRELKGQD